MSLEFFNTLTRAREPFAPLEVGKVSIYSCGPTVYHEVHLGNLRSFLFADLLRRSLEFLGFSVRHVMNITDVGHLESDADEGDDKMLKGAQREKKTVWEVARHYEELFLNDITLLGLKRPHVLCRATEHIQAMQDMVKTLESKGFTYTVDGNVYFDISKFPDYAKLGKLDLDRNQAGARIEADSRKRHPADFALWFTTSSTKFPNQAMQWDSPWGRGFPGWHIECSAMATQYLGERFDIHTGGTDLIPVHHSNEIAQSECALGHRWVSTWLHGEFLVNGEGAKMSKSTGDFLSLKTFLAKGFKPEHYRFFCLGAHYRSPLNFTWEAATAARSAYENLTQRLLSWKGVPGKVDAAAVETRTEAFNRALEDDLNMPAALALAWDVAKDSSIKEPTKLALLLDFDRVLGLGLASCAPPALDEKSQALMKEREAARARKDFKESDRLRAELLAHGLVVRDTPQGPVWHGKFE
ncbi:MAG: cysteine--tRNA ligase [Planctomycetota bacterium]